MSLTSRFWRHFPSSCVICSGPALKRRICAGCRRDLPRLRQCCPRCAEPLQTGLPAGLCCARCQRQPPPWNRCIAAGPWEWPLDAAIKSLKYSARLSLAPAFGELLAPLLAGAFPHADGLCPVPLHRVRHFRRGFNQAHEICRYLRRASGLPLLSCVRRCRNTLPQSGLGQSERRRNLGGAFAAAGTLARKRPVIVDDVMTTGETCRQLAQLLLEMGAYEVNVLVVARAAARA